MQTQAVRRNGTVAPYLMLHRSTMLDATRRTLAATATGEQRIAQCGSATSVDAWVVARTPAPGDAHEISAARMPLALRHGARLPLLASGRERAAFGARMFAIVWSTRRFRPTPAT